MTGTARLVARMAVLAVLALTAIRCATVGAGPSGQVAEGTRPVSTAPAPAPTPTPSRAPAPSPPPPVPTPSPSPTFIDPSAWQTYHSNRYGFTIGYPATASVMPATSTWSMARDRNDWNSSNGGAEEFIENDGSLLMTAWAERVPAGTSLDAWLTTYCGFMCPALANSLPIEIDGHPGKLVHGPDDVQAFVKVGTKVYAMAAWYWWAEPNLRAFVSTMHIDAAPRSSASPSPR